MISLNYSIVIWIKCNFGENQVAISVILFYSGLIEYGTDEVKEDALEMLEDSR